MDICWELVGCFTNHLHYSFRLLANMISGKIMIIANRIIFIFVDLFGPVAGIGLVSLFLLL